MAFGRTNLLAALALVGVVTAVCPPASGARVPAGIADVSRVRSTPTTMTRIGIVSVDDLPPPDLDRLRAKSGSGEASVAEGEVTEERPFLAMTRPRHLVLFGRSADVVPPDGQIAAGPASIVQVDSASVSVWSKSGDLIKAWELRPFFDIRNHANDVRDVMVAYDVAARRWFIAAVKFDGTRSHEYTAVSVTDDPTGSWYMYGGGPRAEVEVRNSRLALTEDKLVMTWDQFDLNGNLLSRRALALKKEDFGVYSSVPGNRFTLPARSSLVPAQMLSPDNDAYIVANRQTPDAHAVDIFVIEGVPSHGDMALDHQRVGIARTGDPPDARQRWVDGISTGDDRFRSAAYRDGKLVAAGNDGCSAPDVRPRSCLRYVGIDVAGNEPRITDDFSFGTSTRDLYYPAVSLDASGLMTSVFTASGRDLYPSVFSTQQSVVGSAPDGMHLIKMGEGPYDRGATDAWGRYSSTSLDPSVPGLTWVMGEFSIGDVSLKDWGTVISPLESEMPPDAVPPEVSDVSDTPDPFTPNSDGSSDHVKISGRLSEGAVVSVTIRSADGTVVRRLVHYKTRGAWAHTWDGRTNSGRLVVSGTYHYVVAAHDEAGNRSVPVEGTTTVER